LGTLKGKGKAFINFIKGPLGKAIWRPLNLGLYWGKFYPRIKGLDLEGFFGRVPKFLFGGNSFQFLGRICGRDFFLILEGELLFIWFGAKRGFKKFLP